jgi:hypothetical protein
MLTFLVCAGFAVAAIRVGLWMLTPKASSKQRQQRLSRQTVLQRVKRGELEAAHVMRGKQKGLRIKVLAQQLTLFDQRA